MFKKGANSLLKSQNSISDLRERIYDKAVAVTLNFYEKYVLPQDQTQSLRQLKLQEFRDRKKMLNPY